MSSSSQRQGRHSKERLWVRLKPLSRNSLSRHYPGRSRSFSSFQDDAELLQGCFGDGALVLSKAAPRGLQNSVRGLDATCTSDQASPLNTADHELYDLLHRLSTAGSEIEDGIVPATPTGSSSDAAVSDSCTSVPSLSRDCSITSKQSSTVRH